MKVEENFYKNIMLRRYSAARYSLSLLGKGDEKFDNVPEVVSDFWSAIATHPGEIDYHLYFDKIAVHGTFNDWHNDPLK